MEIAPLPLLFAWISWQISSYLHFLHCVLLFLEAYIALHITLLFTHDKFIKAPICIYILLLVV